MALKTKLFNELITFTRASAATRTNAQGLIESVSTDQPRFDYDPVTLQPKGLLIEEQRTNLLSASQDFEAPVWGKSYVKIIANAVVAPDGTISADKLIMDSGVANNTANTEGASRSITGLTGGATYTLSFYAKPAELSVVRIRENAYTGAFAVINLATKTITSNGAFNGGGTVTDVGNGWCRVVLVRTLGASDTNIYFSFRADVTGDGVSGYYIWGAQLEAGAFATSYVATPLSFTSRSTTATYRGTNGLIQTAAINTARYEPNSSGGSNLLLESAATNLLTYSEQFDDAAWTKSNATITANAVTAPDGTLTADKLVLSAIATGSAVQTKSVTAGNSYTHSAYVKAGELAYFQISDNTWNASWGQTTSAACTFNLSAGTAGAVATSGAITGASASINSVGNGWYRCAISYTITAGTDVTNTQQQNNAVTAGVVGQGLYIWGAQLETGSVATSYIPTTTAQVTRAADVYSAPTVTRSADVATMTGTNFSSWYNQSEGTLFVDVTDSNNYSGAAGWSASAAIDDNVSGYANISLIRGGAAVVLASSGSTTNWVNSGWSKYKVALGIKGGDFAYAKDGVLDVVKTSPSAAPVGQSQLSIGWIKTNGSSHLNGHIKRLAYYPKRLSNTELQAVTA